MHCFVTTKWIKAFKGYVVSLVQARFVTVSLIMLWHYVSSLLKHAPFLRSNRENCEHVKYLRNVYCVMTNHRKDQGTRTSHKITN